MLAGMNLKEGLQRIIKSQAEVQHLSVDNRRLEQMISNLIKDGKLKDMEIGLKKWLLVE